MSWFSSKADPLAKQPAPPTQVAAWLEALGVLAGLTGPIREQDLFPVADALQASSSLTAPEAAAIASWLGGYAHSSSFFSNAFQLGDPDVYLDVENLDDTTNGPTLVIADVLRTLVAANPAAHAWVIDRAMAKRDRKAQQSDADLEQHRLGVINAEIDLATDAGETALHLADGVVSGTKSLIDGAAAVLSKPWIVIGVVVAIALVLGVLFLVLRSRLERLVA